MSVIESFRVDLLDRNDRLIRKLDTTSQGKLTLDASQPIQRGGKINVIDDGETNWIAHRLQVWYMRQGSPDTSLGIYIPTAPVVENRTGMRTLPLEIHDKTLIYNDDELDDYFYVNYSDVVTDRIKQLIESTGETKYSITASPLTMNDFLVWEPGITKLEVINTLLKYINYNNLWVDDFGTTMVTPYMAPMDRPLARTFAKGPTAIHKSNWKLSRELDKIPNKVILKTAGSGDEEGMRAFAQNNDPNSPYSVPSVGRVIARTEAVDAESPAILQQLADRRLLELSEVYGIIEVEHLMVPLSLGNRVRFISDSIDITAIVETMDINLKPGSLVNGTWKEIR